MLLSKAFKLIFVAVSVNTVPAIAGVLYSSLPNLDVAPDGNVWNSTPCSGVKCNLVADKFSLQTLSLITEIQFSVENNYGESAGPESFKDGVDLDIWTNDGGTPGAISVSEGTNVEQYTQTSFGTTIVTAPLSWIELPAAEYWIGPVPGNNNLDLLGIPGYVGGSGSLVADSTPYPYHFVPTGDSAAFIILGGPPGIPEPSTWAMMLLGFVGLGFVGYLASAANG